MASKTIYMNGGSDDGYVYSDEDIDQDIDQEKCNNSECSDIDQNYDYEHVQEEELPKFYEKLKIIQEPVKIDTETKIKTKSRSQSIDSDVSEIVKRPNFKCGSCKKSFLLDKNQKMIRCSFCGYRILYKLRTRAYITYKTE
jgi:DNA-directed RNA polymerase subunit RPC12/RpoP